MTATVLLAEHEPEVAEMSARYLRRDGLQVRLVTAPEQALAGLTGGREAAAVLDLTMPGLDLRRIRRALRGGDGAAPPAAPRSYSWWRARGRAAWRGRPAAGQAAPRGGGSAAPSAPGSWSPRSARCWRNRPPRPRGRGWTAAGAR